jgi:hypothetical protein
LDSGISGKAGAGWSLPKDLIDDQSTDWLVEFMIRGLGLDRTNNGAIKSQFRRGTPSSIPGPSKLDRESADGRLFD